MSRPRRIRWLLVPASAIVLAVTGAGALHNYQTIAPITAAASPGEETAEPVLCFGHVDVEPGLTALAPERAGRVAAVLVHENQTVAAGELLLRLDDRAARLQVEQARAELAEARQRLEDAQALPSRHKAQLDQQRAAVEATESRRDAGRRRHTRLQRLAKKELCSDDEVRAAADELRALEAAVRGESARLADLELIDPALTAGRVRALAEAREAQLEQAEHALRQCSLTAPERGRVLRLLARPGEMMTDKATHAAIDFCPDRPRIIRAEVLQERAARVAVGAAVLLEDDGDPSLHWHGKVARISDWYTRRRSILQDPVEMQDVRTLECIIEPEAGAHLRIGQKMRVTITAQHSRLRLSER
ncbi:MAG TPA: biotin/lipoyl-binding protein [Gemmataceae bacterium]|nr:biotin/lipoyl-binding protein [Gemmataceae bacterium]